MLWYQVFRKVTDIPGDPVDVVDVFRRPEDIPQHLEDLIAARPKVVWLQSGISNPKAEQTLREHGIHVIADRCLMVDRQMALARL